MAEELTQREQDNDIEPPEYHVRPGHHRFLTARKIDAARRAVQAIRQRANLLEQRPGVGHPIDDMPDETHEWIIDFCRGVVNMLAL